MLEVVGLLEGDELGAVGLGPTPELVVEELLPGRCVDGGGVGDHPVEVEDHGVEVAVEQVRERWLRHDDGERTNRWLARERRRLGSRLRLTAVLTFAEFDSPFDILADKVMSKI